MSSQVSPTPARDSVLDLSVLELPGESVRQSFQYRSQGSDGITRAEVVRDESETPAAFASRLGQYLKSLKGQRRSLRKAVVVLGPHSNEEWLSARCQVARTLLSELISNAGHELVFVAPRANDGLRQELAALVEVLRLQLWGAPVEIKCETSVSQPDVRRPLACDVLTLPRPKRVQVLPCSRGLGAPLACA